MDRMDALEAFLAVCNTVEPPHPYEDEPYPLSGTDVAYGVTRSYFARCGPRKPDAPHTVAYSTRLTYLQEISRERHLALLTHEVTHVTVGSHSDREHGSHPPRFWDWMATNAEIVADELRRGALAERFPDADVDVYLDELIADPNASTVDRRYWTVAECRDHLADRLNVHREPDRDDGGHVPQQRG